MYMMYHIYIPFVHIQHIVHLQKALQDSIPGSLPEAPLGRLDPREAAARRWDVRPHRPPALAFCLGTLVDVLEV